MENIKLLNATFSCSNDIVEASYRLSLMEWRVLEACIAQIDTHKELQVTDRFELSAKDFAKLYGIAEESAYSELKGIAKQLLSRQILINNPDPEHPEIKQTRTLWITSIDYLPTHGKLYLFFSPKIIPYISELKGKFTQCELRNIACLKTTYGARLYLLLMQWKTTRTRIIEIDWLKKQLELDESYSRMDNLKARVIEPAVKDINKNSDYTVKWTQRKSGRSVTHLIFTFHRKKEIEEALPELPKPEPTAADAEPPADTTPLEPPKPRATITLTDEQQKCFEWAKNQDHWKKYTLNKKSFLTCFNSDAEGGIKAQWIATLPAAAKPKAAKTTKVLEKEEALKKTHMKNELANLKNLHKLSPNPAIAEQISELEAKLEELRA